MRYLLVANPRSGRNRGEAAAREAAAALVALGAEAEIRFTSGPDTAGALAAELAPDFDRVLAVGGDGTLNEVLAGVVAPHPARPLGVIPVGTANVIARELGLPLGRPARAARALHRGAPVPVAWGLANGRPFVANVGAGFDAIAVHRLTEARRARPGSSPGMLGYLPIGWRIFRHWRSPRLRATVDDRELEGTFSSAIICNARNYGGVLELTPDADLGSMSFRLAARRGEGRLTILRHLAWGFLGWKDSARRVTLAEGRRLEIRSDGDEGAEVQVDGDPRGRTPLVVELASEPLQLLAPRRR
ncbi:MAG: diacylglycerol kinase family protein [Planctomycetota bacterium]